jgi:succinoglycan biosynthesis transport protein ExoP
MPALSNGNTPEYFEEDSIDLLEMWHAVLRRKWMIIAIFMAAVIAAGVFSQLVTPIYEATTTVMIQDQSGAGQFAIFEAFGGAGKNVNQNYIEVLKSRTLAERAMEKLGYDREVVSLAEFRNSISVQLVTGTDAIRIKVQHTDPQVATDRANAIVAAFMELNQEVNSEEARSARVFIEDQIKAVEKDLEKAEDVLREYKEKEKVFAPSDEAKTVLSRLNELEKAQAEATVELTQIKLKLDELHKRLQEEAPTTITSTTVTNNPMVSQYRTRLFELESQLTAIEAQYNPDYPRIATLKTEIAGVTERLTQEVERIVSSETHAVNPNYQTLASQIVTLEVNQVAEKARQEALSSQIKQVEKDLANLPGKEVELTRLMRNQSVLEEMYMLLRSKHEEYRITEAVQAAGISIVDKAVAPNSPVKPKKKQNVAIAGMLGLMIGVGLTLLIEFLDTTLKTPEDIERYLGIPVVGSIPVFDANGQSKHRRKSHRSRRSPVKQG